jgi:Mor family transcriptional regulator
MPQNPEAQRKLMLRFTKSQRNKDIVAKRDLGEKYTDIAKEYGINESRVRQIYKRDK